MSGVGWVRARRGVVFGGRDEADVAAIGGSAVRGQLPQLSPGAEMIGLELISALDVTECLRLLAAGLGLVRGREVNG